MRSTTAASSRWTPCGGRSRSGRAGTPWCCRSSAGVASSIWRSSWIRALPCPCPSSFSRPGTRDCVGARARPTRSLHRQLRLRGRAQLLEQGDERLALGAREPAGGGVEVSLVTIEDAGDERASRPRERHSFGAAIVRVGGALDQALLLEPIDGGGDASARELDAPESGRALG